VEAMKVERDFWLGLYRRRQLELAEQGLGISPARANASEREANQMCTKRPVSLRHPQTLDRFLFSRARCRGCGAGADQSVTGQCRDRQVAGAGQEGQQQEGEDQELAEEWVGHGLLDTRSS